MVGISWWALGKMTSSLRVIDYPQKEGRHGECSERAIGTAPPRWLLCPYPQIFLSWREDSHPAPVHIMANPTAAEGGYVNGRGRRPPQATNANPPEPASPSAEPPPQTNGVHAPPAPGQGYFPSGGRGGFVPGFRGCWGGFIANAERVWGGWGPFRGRGRFLRLPWLLSGFHRVKCIWGFLGRAFVTAVLAWSFAFAIFSHQSLIRMMMNW